MDVTPQQSARTRLSGRAPLTGRKSPSRLPLLGVLVAVVVALMTVSACATPARHTPAGHAGPAVASGSGPHGATGLPAPHVTGVTKAVPSTGTVTRTFSAYRDGKLAVAVANRVSGSCWESSLAAPADGAYRCLSGNQILDPCFANPIRTDPARVACVTDPWSRATMLNLTKKLPASTPIASTRPWAVVLGHGARCVAVTGTAAFVHGVSLDYTCHNRTSATLRHLRARTAKAIVGSTAARPLKHTTVATIWRA